MLGLVDYEASDSEGEEEKASEEEESQTQRVLVTSPRKGVNVLANLVDSSNVDIEEPNDNSFGQGFFPDSVPDRISASLPSVSQPSVVTGPLVSRDELDDLVKRKDWEIKAAKKAEKKKKKLEKLRKKELKKLRKRESSNGKSTEPVVRKKIRIDAFGGLDNIDTNSGDDYNPNVSSAVKESGDKKNKGLLSLLPKPHNEVKYAPKGTTIMLPSSLRSRQETTTEVKVLSPVRSLPDKPTTSAEYGDSDDEEGDVMDLFGLNKTEETTEAMIEPKLNEVSFGPSKPVFQSEALEYLSQHAVSGDAIINEVDPSTSGVIDDTEAARLIYSHDVAPLGGTEINASSAVGNIVDVSVDEALGPNIRSNLLKNLHNKSLAEAAISHLAKVPRPKDAKDAVARRKHQITYLASVAVAREEQLAEQWSQSRHNKRMSAQKYGF